MADALTRTCIASFNLPEVISLIKRFLYINDDFRYCLHVFPHWEPLSYPQDSDIKRSCDLATSPHAPKLDYIILHDIPLTGPGDEGPHFVLDVSESMSFIAQISNYMLVAKADLIIRYYTRDPPG